MFNIGAGEAIVILVVALLVLGPQRLPEMARALGKFLREFRRQTDEVRVMVEREFYRMDVDLLENQPKPKPATPSVLPAATAAATAPADAAASIAPVLASTPVPAPDAQSVAAAANAVDPAAVAQSPAPEVLPASPIQNEVFRAIPRAAPLASAPRPEPKTELALPAADTQLKN